MAPLAMAALRLALYTAGQTAPISDGHVLLFAYVPLYHAIGIPPRAALFQVDLADALLPSCISCIPVRGRVGVGCGAIVAIAVRRGVWRNGNVETIVYRSCGSVLSLVHEDMGPK